MPAGAPKLRFLVPKFAHQEGLECLPTSFLAHFNEANIRIRILCLHYLINTNTQFGDVYSKEMCIQFIMALKGNTLHDAKEMSPLEALTFMTLDLYRV